MAQVEVLHKCHHRQMHWIPNFKYRPGPEGQRILDKTAQDLCTPCFFDRIEKLIGRRIGS